MRQISKKVILFIFVDIDKNFKKVVVYIMSYNYEFKHKNFE